jgi:hypothetical protein
MHFDDIKLASIAGEDQPANLRRISAGAGIRPWGFDRTENNRLANKNRI